MPSRLPLNRLFSQSCRQHNSNNSICYAATANATANAAIHATATATVPGTRYQVPGKIYFLGITHSILGITPKVGIRY
jgi:hypothetical protein